MRSNGLDVPNFPSISVILPAYNEAPNIGPMIDACISALPGMADDFEVLVVDDGSTDETAAIVGRYVDKEHPRVRLLSLSRNSGYGAAVRTGFACAHKELAFYTDADRQFDVSELASFQPLIADHDLVIGFRLDRQDSLLRRGLSWIYNRLVGLLFRVNTKDVDCAFKLIRTEAFGRLELSTTDFFIDTEIVAAARRQNLRIAQLGVSHYPRLAGQTTVRPSDVPRTLLTVARIWRNTHLKRWTREQGPNVLPKPTEVVPVAGSVDA